MTSLGILGTFIGVVIGLLHFDTAHIDTSIPSLLDGLKTAFITSIVGMVFAMVFNAVDAWIFSAKRENSEVIEEVTPKHIYSALQSQTEALQQMAAGITGNEEGSLVGQIKLLKSDLNDNSRRIGVLVDDKVTEVKSEISNFSTQTKTYQAAFSQILWKKLEEFAELMAKGATAQIIEALQKVIQDFNNNLTEQFGENFKRLDESVKKLVDWQIEYKEQIEVMASQYRECVDALKDTSVAVAGVDASCQGIPVSMDKLSSVMQVNQHQIQELQRHLEAFVTMRDAAVEAVPTINQKLDEISQQMLIGANEMRVALNEGADQFRDSVKVTTVSVGELANTVKNTSEQLSETLKDTAQEISTTSRDTLTRMQDSAKGIQTSIADTAREMDDQSRKINDGFSRSAAEFERSNKVVMDSVAQSASQLQDEIKASSEKMINSLRQQIDQSISGMDGHMKGAIDKAGSTINTELEKLEQATAREIQRAIDEMGQSLLRVTTRFAGDYESMVNRMDEVIRNHAPKV
jgi:predicted  nucleic acid-binding Zn-ribbon protein